MTRLHTHMHMHISDCTLRARRDLFVPGCACVALCTKNRGYGYVESVDCSPYLWVDLSWCHMDSSPYISPISYHQVVRQRQRHGTVLRFPRENAFLQPVRAQIFLCPLIITHIKLVVLSLLSAS